MKDFFKKFSKPQTEVEDLDSGYDSEYYAGSYDKADRRDDRQDDRRPVGEPERFDRLWDVTNYALEGFRNMGCEIGNTCTPIIPLYVRDNDKTFLVTRMLLDDGIFVIICGITRDRRRQNTDGNKTEKCGR